MSVKKARGKSENSKRNSGWDEAIRDAKRKIKGLESTIRVFRERKRAGEPWPGEGAGTGAKSIPA